MQQIVLFGAGKSATCLIDYLVIGAATGEWQATIADSNAAAVTEKTGDAIGITAVGLDVVNDTAARQVLVQKADVVISLMPPALHHLIAQDCLQLGRHLLTASYTDAAMKALQPQIEAKNLLFLCEMGLDPGIDHMSAMKLIDEIRAKGGAIHSFKSHCGGLVAPESDTNPWHYKISWNPRNIVLAGKAGAIFKESGVEKSLQYEQLFNNAPILEIPGSGPWSYYPNRDSLSYMPVYRLENTDTFLRTTLRHPSFMQAWAQVARLEFTAESPLYDTAGMSLAAFFKKIASDNGHAHWLDEFIGRVENTNAPLSEAEAALLMLGLNDETTLIRKEKASAADVLQEVLERQLKLQPGDKDMILMMHELGYTLNGKNYETQSWLQVKGEDALHTAMAKTVGLPLGIAAKLLLNGILQRRGLCIPVQADIYNPVLAELEGLGVQFEERTVEV